MDAAAEAENIAKLMDFVNAKPLEEPMREAVIRFYMELGNKSGVTAAKEVGVIVSGANVGTVDCALAIPASVAVAYAEDRLGAMLGLWTLAEFSPKTAVLALSPHEGKLFSDIAAIIRRSQLLRNSPIRFVIFDLKSGAREIIQRRDAENHYQGRNQGRRKIIKGSRQPHKKQD